MYIFVISTCSFRDIEYGNMNRAYLSYTLCTLLACVLRNLKITIWTMKAIQIWSEDRNFKSFYTEGR